MVSNNFVGLYSRDVIVGVKRWVWGLGCVPCAEMCFGQGNTFPGTLQEFCMFVKETHFQKHLVGKCLAL